MVALRRLHETGGIWIQCAAYAVGLSQSTGPEAVISDIILFARACLCCNYMYRLLDCHVCTRYLRIIFVMSSSKYKPSRPSLKCSCLSVSSISPFTMRVGLAFATVICAMAVSVLASSARSANDTLADLHNQAIAALRVAEGDSFSTPACNLTTAHVRRDW